MNFLNGAPSMNIRSIVLASLTSILIACGPAETKGGNGSNGNSSNGNNEPATVTDILPDGYDAVEAGRFSPDGSRLAMVATPPGDDAIAELITTDLTGGDVEVLVSEGLSYLTTIAWMPDGESVVYGGGGGIMEVERDGSSPTLRVDSFAVESVDLSADGRLVSWSVNGGTSVTTAPVSAEPRSTDEHIFGPDGDMPRFGADGQIAYISADGVVVSAPNGDDAQTYEAATNFYSNPAWQDDGTVVVITDFGLTAIDLATGESTDVHEQFAAIGLDVSPDGSMFVVGVNGQKSLRLGPL
jgi:Tol biopolymer transport system component